MTTDLTRYRAMLARKPGRGPRIGRVIDVAMADMKAMVLLDDGEVEADLTDQVMDYIGVGVSVTLTPIGGTYEVSSTRSGSGGGGGLTLGPELLPNPSFEYGGDGLPTSWATWPWVAGSYAAARDVTPGEAVSGDAHLRVTLTGGDDAPDVWAWNRDAALLDPGTTYQGSVWVKAAAGDASLTVTLSAVTAPTAAGAAPFGAGATGHTIATVTNPGGAYQLLTGFFTTPAGHGFGRVYLSCDADSTIAAPVVVAWDVASLRQRITD